MQQNQDFSMVEDEGILHLDSQQELHEMDQQYEGTLYTPSLEINEDNRYLSKRKQKVLSPLSEDEIDQLLHGYVPAQAKADLQCTHGQESVGETSSSFKKGNSLVNNFIDQQAEDFHMAGNDERRSFVSDLVEIKDDMQENDVPISDNGDAKSD